MNIENRCKMFGWHYPTIKVNIETGPILGDTIEGKKYNIALIDDNGDAHLTYLEE